MNELEQLRAEAISDCAALGAALGGFLGNLTTAQLEAILSTRPYAETTKTQIASDYEPGQLKTDAMASVQALINVMPGGG